MKVYELKEILSEIPDDAEIYCCASNSPRGLGELRVLTMQQYYVSTCPPEKINDTMQELGHSPSDAVLIAKKRR
jgi:hypothetical protein